MNWSMMFAVARAEMRSNRRLFRYWLFAVLAVIVGVSMFGQFTFLHGAFSHLSATIGSMGPRYLIAAVGIYLILIFLVGLIFLAFDVRARDERDHMAEVLDSRPLTNAEFLLGKVIGLVLLSWMPVLFIALLFQGFGLIATIGGWPVGEAVEPRSLIGFLFQMLTVLSLWCAVIVFVAVLVRNRLAVAAIVLGLLGLQIWAFLKVPLYLSPMVSVLPTFDMASDVLPRFIPDGEWMRILAQWVLAAAFISFALAVHPRRDDSTTTRNAGVGALCIAFAAGLMAVYFAQATAMFDRQDIWRAAHEAKQDQPRPDVQRISGVVVFDPGSSVNLDLDLAVRSDQPLQTLLFSLNPGLNVDQLQIAGSDVPFTHDNGLLEIALPQSLRPGADLTMNLVASGSPDIFFGYLDTFFNFLRGDFSKGQLGMLGIQTSVFDSKFVAMMPGAHWIPSSGTDVPQSDPRKHPHDYYLLDLEVEIPADWLVAGPGRRQEVSSNEDTRRVRFNPDSPVPHVGLIASEFARREMSVGDVTFEVLFHPSHTRNLDFFAEAVEPMKDRIGEVLDTAQSMGLPYPYDNVTLVETPNVLRGYGGGWRMDTVQAMPGVMMIRENSFPTSRFEALYANEQATAELVASTEGGLAADKLKNLERYFENDFSGGNVFTGGARNFMQFQTSAVGEGAHALNFILDELTSRLLTGRHGYFSAHEFDESMNLVMGQVIQDMMSGRSNSIAQSVQRAATDRPSVWDRALGNALASLEPNDDPRQSLNVLVMKSEAIANSMLDGLGREKTAALLSQLLREFRGQHFHVTDFYRIAIDQGIDLQAIAGDWLYDASLPGFLASTVTSVRLQDDELGNPRYQTRVHIRNDENTPGLVKLNYQWYADKKTPIWDNTEPVRIAANSSVEVGIVSSSPLGQLFLAPYLSLNRQDLKLSVPNVDSKQLVDDEQLLGAIPSEWRPMVTDDIVVDDLDAGFAVIKDGSFEEPERIGGPFGNSFAVDMDQGLPEFKAMFGTTEIWSRSTYNESWGKYRHTHALVGKGEEARRAAFTTELPHAGRWRLSYYLGLQSGKTAKRGPGPGGLTARMLGKYDMALITDDEKRDIEFDGAAAQPGWNDLGEFQLEAGEARLEISNSTTGFVVIADAIRWRPAT
jgi:ABC-type transport system involved in multi-copper enzyme maturation permease subunit